MSTKKLKAPVEVVKKALKALQNSNSNPASLAQELQVSVLTVQDFFAGEAIEHSVALRICKQLNIMPQSGGNSEIQSAVTKPLPSSKKVEAKPPKPEKITIPTQRNQANFLPSDRLLDQVFATDEDDFKGQLKFEPLPKFQPIASNPSAKGFMLLTDPAEQDLTPNLEPIAKMSPLAKPIIYRHEEEAIPIIEEIESPQLPISQDLEDYQEQLNQLVTELCDRLQNLITTRCSKLRILGMERSIALADIYVEPKLWTELPSDRWLGISELELAYKPKSFSIYNATAGFGSAIDAEPITVTEAINQHSHLIILGGLGSGKTSLLKHLAQKTLQNKAHLVPLYLELRNVDESSFSDYLIQYLIKISGIDPAIAITLLREGRFLLLLDGLDNVAKAEQHRLCSEIADFAALYANNAIIVTSRIAIANIQFQAFSQVALADFDRSQIESFAQKWFGSWEGISERAEPFLHQLNGDRRLAEIATNPLTLTLQCLAYGRSDFFAIDLFRESLQLRIKQWEEIQSINLHSLDSKLNALQKWQILAEFAFKMIEQDQYFFGYTQLQQQIQALLLNQTDFSCQFCDPAILIEELCNRHGLLRVYARSMYGFNQPAWQQYLAAKWIAKSNKPEVLNQLLNYVADPNWQAVFLFVAGILANSDHYLLSLHNAINALIDSDSEIQRYLSWANQQANSLKAQYKPVVIRAMYCDVDFEKMRVLDRNRALEIANTKSIERARMRSLGSEGDSDSDAAFELNQAMEKAIELDLAMDFSKQRILSLARLLEPKMDRRLGWLGGQIPDPQKSQSQFMQWWQSQGGEWAKILRETILQYRKTIKDWNFTEPQLELLRRFHYANILLIECLNSSRQVSPEVQQQIEDSLLKPTAK